MTSIVIPVRDDRAALEACLDSISLAAQNATDVGIEIIVVDNGSRDGSAQLARARGAHVLERPSEKVAALRNRGASIAKGELLAFVDADHVVDPGWLSAIRDVFGADNVDAVGCPYEPPSGGTWVQQIYNGLRDHRPGQREVRWLGSGNLILRREAFLEVGGFDESLETCEDVAFCYSLTSRGYRILADSRLRSVHFGDPSSLPSLFLAELWRGRDNLRVSLRQLSAWRDVPSVAMPVALVLAPIAILASMITGQGWLGLMFAAGLLILPTLRGILIARRVGAAKLGVWFQALAFGFVYEYARAAALVIRQPHRSTARRNNVYSGL